MPNKVSAAKGIRQWGWIWRDGKPIEVEYECGFAAEDGFPYRIEVRTGIPLSVEPASSREDALAARSRYLQNTISEHQQAIHIARVELKQCEAMMTSESSVPDGEMVFAEIPTALIRLAETYPAIDWNEVMQYAKKRQ